MTRLCNAPFCGDEPQARHGVFDAPTESDHRRLRRARRHARARVNDIEATRDREILAALRAEMGAVVRSAAPILISLVAREGLTLDEAVALIRPAPQWPHHARLSKREVHADLGSYYSADMPQTELLSWYPHLHRFDHFDGTYLEMHVAEHSLDLYARIDGAVLETRFGELRVELEDELPETLLVASVGRTLDEVVDHELWRGRGWKIVGTRDAFLPLSGQTIIVAMGTVEYRMPWTP